MIEIIVAVDETGGYSRNGEIPWINDKSITKPDFEWFREKTMGKACVMGRKTYQDMLEIRGDFDGDILYGRRSYVISRTLDSVKGARLAQNLLRIEESNLIVLGGRGLWVEALPFTSKVYMTIIPGDWGCDKRFPVELLSDFRIVKGKMVDGLMFVEYSR